ncbi:Soma ferritin [Halotydeus destructor]|nr:Soma ferritin [Halotydeus destructor]
MAVSQVRQNFHAETEAGINKQISLELYASHVYLSMAAYFDRDDVALAGYSKYFLEQSKEEREHGEKLIKYQNQRGGRYVSADIQKPDSDDWTSGLCALQSALALEKKVNQSLLDLHSLAGDHGDAQFQDFLESEYLTEQVEAIKAISDLITNAKRTGTGLGEYLFDHETMASA